MRIATLKVALVYSPAPRQVSHWEVDLADGSTLGDALHTCAIFLEFPELCMSSMTVGVWGKRALMDKALHDGDRIEVYRALRVDPKVARRERFSRQGSRGAGLFSGTRPGAKAGY